MNPNSPTWRGLLVLTLSVGSVAAALSQNAPAESVDADNAALEPATAPTVDAGAPFEEGELDAGLPTDGTEPDVGPEAERTAPAVAPPAVVEKDTEIPRSAEQQPKEEEDWRRDTTARRRPGSYIGGVVGYGMAHAWYTTTQKDLALSFDIGPVHLSATEVRVGDAFFDWLAVGFQISLISLPNIPGVTDTDAEAHKMGGFGLYLDTTFYPWRGLGLRPSLGIGFSFSQAGSEAYEFGFGGPANFAFSISYEFRVMRLFTLGPMVQVAWIRGDDYDSLFLTIGLEILKWFKTAKG